MMLLSKLEIEGLKGGKKTLIFSPEKKIHIFSGPNGTGKTTVLQALHLLLRGKVPRSSGMNPASAGKDILKLSSGKSIKVTGEWDNGIFVSREWKKSGDGAREFIDQNIDPETKGIKEQQGLLNLYFGNVGEVWDPGQFFGLSPAKMRARLMASVGVRPVKDVLDMLPKEMPQGVAPGNLDMPAENWLNYATKEVDRQLNETRTEIRDHKKRLEEGNAFIKYRSEKEIKEDLKELLERLYKAKSLDRYTDKLSHLRGRLSVLEEQVGKIEIEIEATLAERDEAFAEGKLARDEDIASIHAEHMKVMEELKVVGAQEELKSQVWEAKEGLEACEKQERKQKRFKEKLKVAEQKLLTTAKKPFEEAISAAVGKECSIDLRSGGCAIRVGGVDISGLSDGESLRFIPGIVAALALGSESKWVPLPLDRFEAISSNERENFIGSVSSLIEKGKLSQAFFAGCPDTVGLQRLIHASDRVHTQAVEKYGVEWWKVADASMNPKAT